MDLSISGPFQEMTPSRHSGRGAFTLLEMLVVIVIIGLLSSIGLVAIKGMTKSNTMIAANRQLLDDLSYARQRAIADHTTVYVVFIPPYIENYPLSAPTDVNVDHAITNLYTAQCTTYAMLSLHSVGDQPGTINPHYLTGWRTLPTGVYIATNKFTYVPSLAPAFSNDVAFPFPFGTNAIKYFLPYLSYNYLGQLVDKNQQLPDSTVHEFIPLVRGSIFYSDNGGVPAADFVETPGRNGYYQSYNSQQALTGMALPTSPVDESSVVYNQIHIDPLTGKPRIERQEVQ